jgi:transcriptional regulator with PAS, ATPase and Fis domain
MASETIPPGEDLIVRSEASRRVLALAERVARVSSPVLLTGESGSGKERIARFIHARSPRAKGPFVAVNCGALPEQLLESELFGHVKGAFTGADRDHKGLFEAAEVGEIPPTVQVKLLRVLQDREIRRVGSSSTRRVDVRIIAATNRDLTDMVRERTFRKDLYYRLKVVGIEVPALRERREDILPLAHRFSRRACAEFACGPCSLSAEVLDRLLAYSWPGNVRELEHAMERAVVLAEGKPKIEVRDLPPEIVLGQEAPVDSASLPLAELERVHILRVLQRFGGNRKETARALGIGANTLWRKLRKYGVLGAQARSPGGVAPGRESRPRRAGLPSATPRR